MHSYQLVMHSGPTPGKTFLLEGNVLTIGREASNAIAINDAEISRKHAQLVYRDGKYIITDLGSTTGTFVNGQRLTGQHVLQPGEVISLGEQISLLFETCYIQQKVINASPEGFQLVMHSGPTPGKVFPLTGDVLTIGREASNNIAINDAEINRKHAQLVYQGGKYIITDLSSVNGTFVNGQRLTGQHILQSGEVISLGEQIALLVEKTSGNLYQKQIDEKRIQQAATTSSVQPKPNMNNHPLNVPIAIKQPRRIRVFLCHASQDKLAVRLLYQKLSGEGWIDPWLDEEKLLPGQNWDIEIEKAVESADAVIVFLSRNSVNKEGYVQQELRFVLNIALTKPEETIFVIPLRLEECEPPRRLRAWHYADFFPPERRDQVYNRLLESLKARFQKLDSNS